MQATSVSVTTDITTTGANGRDESVAEKVSEHYALYVIGKADGTVASLLKQWTTSGTTTATTANKLVDSGGDFSTDGLVEVGDTVINQTANPTTTTTVSAIDSDTTLSLADDIFTSGDEYRIVLGRAPTMPSGYTFKRRVGSVYNNSSGNFRDFLQAGKKVWITPWTSYTYLSGGSAASMTPVWPEVPPSASIAEIQNASSGGSTSPAFSYKSTGNNKQLNIASGRSMHHSVPLKNGGHYYALISGTGTVGLSLIGYEDNF